MCYKGNDFHAMRAQAGGLSEMGGQKGPLRGAGFEGSQLCKEPEGGALGEGTANTEALRREERGFSRTLGRTYVCLGPSKRGEGDAGQGCRRGRDHRLQDAPEELGSYSFCLFVFVLDYILKDTKKSWKGLKQGNGLT